MKTLIAILLLSVGLHGQELPSKPLILPTDLAQAVEESKPTVAPRSQTPKWATAIAIAGPLADGVSTYWAIKQSGPIVRVAEGNAFYYKLFGSNVKASEILMFKIGQAALLGYSAHHTGKKSKTQAVTHAMIQGAIHFTVSALNVRNGLYARNVNKRPRS